MTAALIFMAAVGGVLIRLCLCEDAVFVKEGDDVTFNCSVEDAMHVWVTSWEISNKGLHRKTITDCFLRDFLEPCPPAKGPLTYRNTTQHYYSDMTVSNDTSFMSQLTILNVTAALRHTDMGCILSLIDNPTFDFMRHKSYPLNVYAVPQTAVCHASLTKDSDVGIACRMSKVYPKMTCQILVEHVTGMGSTAPDRRVIQMLQPGDTAYTEYILARYKYYNVSCHAKYVPVHNGNYRFHCEMSTSNNFTVMSVESNWVAVVAPPGKYQQPYTRNKTTGSGQKDMGVKNGQDGAAVKSNGTNTAFHTLLGVIMLLGLTGLAAIFWVTWSRCRKKYASVDGDYVSQSNIYELMEREESKRGDESPRPPGHRHECGDERVDDNLPRGADHNGDNSSARDLLGTYDNQTIELLRQCLAAWRSHHGSDAYITPCTPPPTSRASTNTSVHSAPSGNDGASETGLNNDDSDGNAVSDENIRGRVNSGDAVSDENTQGENIRGRLNSSNAVSVENTHGENIQGRVNSSDAVSDENTHGENTQGRVNSSDDFHGHANSNNDNYDDDDTNGDDIGSADSTFNSSHNSFVCDEVYISPVCDEVYISPVCDEVYISP